jgi:hypothetical protein
MRIQKEIKPIDFSLWCVCPATSVDRPAATAQAASLTPWQLLSLKLDSSVSMVEPAKDRMCNNSAGALNRARVRCILPQRNMGTRVIIIGSEFRKDPLKVIFVDHDQMIGAVCTEN